MSKEELSEIDYRILEFVNKKGCFKASVIRESLSDIESLDLRLRILSAEKMNLLQYYNFDIDALFEDPEKPNGDYSITDLGKKTLQDYNSKIKKEKNELWLKNAWIPIIVSVVTTLAINGLQWLIPQILKWLSNFHG